MRTKLGGEEMKHFEEVASAIDRILLHELDRRPRLTKKQYATILDALCCLGDIYETADEMKHSEAVSYLMAAIPHLTRAEAKERLR